MITSAEKKEAMKKFGRGTNDSGSPEVQVALLTKRIENLSSHFQKHKLDNSGKRGLLKMVGRRKSLLTYLSRTSPERYQKVILDLGLRK